MLDDLDETLRQLLIQKVPLDPNEVDVSFDTPDREWSGRLTRPTVNCFLYAVRENVDLRPSGWEVRRDNSNNLAARARRPLRVDASYQITTWARAREDEHRLLWRVLATLVRFAPLPTEYLVGSLRQQPAPIQVAVARPDETPSNHAELWHALDNRIRPVLTYVVTLALDPDQVITEPVVRQAPAVGVDTLDRRAAEAALLVRGRVRDRTDPTRTVSGALVILSETGGRAFSDDGGWFAFANAPRGSITLIVRADGRAETTREVTVPAASYDLEV
jgi:hypothetical protein